MRHQFKSLSRRVALTMAVLLASSAGMAAEKVMIAEFKYPAAAFRVNVIKVLLEERLGIESDTATGDHAMFYAGMHRGKGDIDIHPEIWQPNQKNFKAEYVDGKGTVVYSDKYHDATSGFCVPKYFSEEHNVKSIFDLGRPDVAKLLDSDGNGKGEIWIGKSGWASTNENHVKARDYGLLPFNDVTKADAAVNIAALNDAVRKHEGYAFYCARPEEVWIRFDIVELEEPPFDPSCHKIINAKGNPDWFEQSKITCKGAAKTVRVAWSKSLEERLPAVTSLLANIDFDLDMVTAASYEIGANKRDPRDVAKEWIDSNKERVDSWFGM